MSGVVEMYGPEIVWAAQIACAEVNERGGVLGRPLELIIEDDGSLPETAVPAALRLVEKHRCVAIIGTLLSNSRIAVASRVAEPRQVPYLNYSFYEGSIEARHFFHFAALPNQQIDPMIPYMAERFGRKMYFAGNNYEWPRGSIDAARRALLAHGGTSVGEEYHPIGVSARDLEGLLDRVERSGTDVFVPYFAGADQVELLVRFSRRGLAKRMAVVMGHYDEVMVSRLPPEVREGLYSSNTYFMSVDTPENRGYLERLATHPGVEGIWPHGNGIVTNFGEGAYVCVHAFANAANDAGSLESASLVSALERVSLRAPQGLVRMDPRTHHAYVNTFLARCRADGTFEIIERFGSNAPEIPERYRRSSSAPPTRGKATYPPPRSSLVDPILSVADASVIVTDRTGRILQANPAACHLFGYSEAELVGDSVHMLIPPQYRHRHVADVHEFARGEREASYMGERGEVAGYRKDGSVFPAEASICRLELDGDRVLVVTLRDITDRKRTEAALTWQATHDPLTQLPNRALIRERLVGALERSARDGSHVALLFLDLDGFKLINDFTGHDVGDAVLVAAANRLVEEVRPGDTVGRLGGDEFVILCEQVDGPDSVAELARRLNEALREPIRIDGHSLFLTVSIGIAVGQGSTHSAEDLLRAGDSAMYVAKDRGRDGFRFFSADLHQEAGRRLMVANGLRVALARQEFRLVCQPIVSTATSRVIGGELLLRWSPPSGDVSPAFFVPIAEVTGSIVPIGKWVFEEACRIEASIRARFGSQAPYLSVNLSTRQLAQEDLAALFDEAMRRSGANPTRIMLEITETSLMSDAVANLEVLRRLADLGLRVAVDDFGTGYSSLAQLLRLPVSSLKIDREFVSRLDTNRESRAITSAVVGMAKALELGAVAEGVENEAQLAALDEMGCEAVQGFLLHRPMSIDAFVDLIARELA